MTSVDEIAKRVVDGNQKDEEKSRSPHAANNAERQIGEGDKHGEGELIPRATELGVEMLAMMVELVARLFSAGELFAVDNHGAVGIGMYAVSIVL